MRGGDGAGRPFTIARPSLSAARAALPINEAESLWAGYKAAARDLCERTQEFRKSKRET